MATRREVENKKADQVEELLDAVDRIEKKLDILLETNGITVIENEEDLYGADNNS